MPFNPNDLSPLLWVDYSSFTPSQWLDKSGNNRHLNLLGPAPSQSGTYVHFPESSYLSLDSLITYRELVIYLSDINRTSSLALLASSSETATAGADYIHMNMSGSGTFSLDGATGLSGKATVDRYYSASGTNPTISDFAPFPNNGDTRVRSIDIVYTSNATLRYFLGAIAVTGFGNYRMNIHSILAFSSVLARDERTDLLDYCDVKYRNNYERKDILYLRGRE